MAAGCSSCGQRRAAAARFEVVDTAGNTKGGPYPTRAEAEAKKVELGAGHSVRLKTGGTPAPATNSTVKK